MIFDIIIDNLVYLHARDLSTDNSHYASKAEELLRIGFK